MEVTRENFRRACAIMEKELCNADFIAVDAEFTGLSTIKEQGAGYDTLEQLYNKTRVGTGQMLLIQYGISLFLWKHETNSYEALPFTFYIFPQLYKGFGNDVFYMSQSSSINYLAHHGFDFNKLFHNGISFMSLHEEEKARESMENNMNSFTQQQQQALDTSKSALDLSVSESKVFIPEDQRKFIGNVCDTIGKFMSDDGCESVDLPVCTPTQRKLIREIVEERYPVGVYLEAVTWEGEEKFVRAHKTAAAMLHRAHEEKHENEERILADVVGFSNVIKLVVKAKKPIIGHNMLLDLFLTTTNFYGPPPYRFRDFKEFVTKLFPIMFDTKVLARTPPLNEILYKTGVHSLIEYIEGEQLPDPKVAISEKLEHEAEYKSHYHQAGYDAYCTGIIFISLAKYLSYSLRQPSDRIDLSCDSLRRYINCVYIMGIRDIFFSDFTRDESVYERKNVFYIRFPHTGKQSDIEDLFTPHCCLSYPINWINEQSAFVTISDEKAFDDVYSNLVLRSGDGASFNVLPYDDFMNNKDPRESIYSSTEDVPRKRKRLDNCEHGGMSVDSELKDNDV